MLPATHLIDAIGTSYLDLLAAAGCTIARPSRDYGVDGTLQQIEIEQAGAYLPGTMALQFQLKTTSRWHMAEDEVTIDIPVRADNLIRRRQDAVAPLYLFLVCLEGEIDAWLSVSPTSLSIRARAFWWRETGPLSQNALSVRLALSSRNVLTPESLRDMLSSGMRRMAP